MQVLLLLTFLILAPELAFTAPALSGSADPLYDEFEGADLAAALLRDGKLDAANSVFSNLSPSEARGRPAFVAKIRADLQLAGGKPADAVASYLQALSSNPTDALRAESELGLSRAYQRLGEAAKCAAASDRAGALVFQSESDILLKAGCERSSGQDDFAWKTLSRGQASQPGFTLFLEEVRLLISLGLRGEASERVQRRLSGKTAPSEAMALAEAFMEAGAKEDALYALETARLRFPQDQDILLAIAPLYFAKGFKRATAEAFSLAAIRDGSYAEHASETLRQLGARQRSRYLNLFIPGEKERGRQKLALAVENSRWDLVSAMDSVVRRSSLNEDDEVNYALGFSLLRGGEAEKARSYLERIRTTSLMNRVSALFKAIEDCGRKGWRCI